MTPAAPSGVPKPAEQPQPEGSPASAAGDCGGCPAGSPPDPVPGEARPAASVVACPNGPLLIRGDFEIVTPDGIPLPRDRETVALCRCGGSAIKPYCDGTHKLMKFDTSRRRPVPPAVVERSSDAAS
ncbi:CDGSH iron-sulfur domain-containing protein [Arthrobacter citreus]|uniref:CDGSH iron-sulfur domain-containing protein n=1 Tax=Arthrobacter citreus TaxID=1670 RepID=UPI003CCB5D86